MEQVTELGVWEPVVAGRVDQGLVLHRTTPVWALGSEANAAQPHQTLRLGYARPLGRSFKIS